MITGQTREDHWKSKGTSADFYYLKGCGERPPEAAGHRGRPLGWNHGSGKTRQPYRFLKGEQALAGIGEVNGKCFMKRFDIQATGFSPVSIGRF